MAEIGIVASIVELTNTGFALGKFLNDTWLAYQNAPNEVLEIAADITICCELMTPLGEQIKASSVNYTSRFQTGVEALVKNSNRTFENIRALMPKEGTVGRGMLPRWKFVLKKDKIDKHRTRLRELQQMFIFMKQTMIEMQSNAALTANQGGQSSQSPITLFGRGVDESGKPVEYSATLVMRPAEKPSAEREEERKKLTREDATRSAASGLRTTRNRLKSLRQSPFFSADLLRMPDEYDRSSHQTCGGPSGLRSREIEEEYEFIKIRDEATRKSHKETIPSQSLLIPDDNEALRDVDILVASWFGDETSCQEQHRPSLTVTDTTVSGLSPTERSPVQSPSLNLSPTVSPRSPKSPTVETYSSAGRIFPGERPLIYDCNGCNKKIRGIRYECQSCKDYDLCKKCFNDPEVTIRLKHRHPKSHFKEISEP